jgi:PIN domain nuclease of toxin-antitoxin system
MADYVLDASALLRFTDKEAGFDRVQELLLDANKDLCAIHLSAVNWAEIVAALVKRANHWQSKMIQAQKIARGLLSLPMTVVPVNEKLAEQAAVFKCDFNLPLADAFAGSLAFHEKATLVTADYDFKNVPAKVMTIDFLPTK